MSKHSKALVLDGHEASFISLFISSDVHDGNFRQKVARAIRRAALVHGKKHLQEVEHRILQALTPTRCRERQRYWHPD